MTYLDDGAIYTEYVPLMKKTMRAKRVDVERDTYIIYSWMNRSHVAEFWNMAWEENRIRDYLKQSDLRQDFDSYIAFMDEQPMAYFELYHPHAEPVGKCYDVKTGDIGLHVLIGEEKYQRRYIIRLSTMMMRLVFNYHPETKRIIGEPDINNTQIQSVMKFVGFKWMANIQLPDKTAALHGLDKEAFIKAHGLEPRQPIYNGATSTTPSDSTAPC